MFFLQQGRGFGLGSKLVSSQSIKRPYLSPKKYGTDLPPKKIGLIKNRAYSGPFSSGKYFPSGFFK
jgi:hypothetical protein